jgi:hypothetical protein
MSGMSAGGSCLLGSDAGPRKPAGSVEACVRAWTCPMSGWFSVRMHMQGMQLATKLLECWGLQDLTIGWKAWISRTLHGSPRPQEQRCIRSWSL